MEHGPESGRGRLRGPCGPESARPLSSNCKFAARFGVPFRSLADPGGRAARVVPFHYDPGHTDAEVDRRFEAARQRALPFELVPAKEAATHGSPRPPEVVLFPGGVAGTSLIGLRMPA